MGVESEFVVAAAKILHEGVSGDDHLRGPIRSSPAHWSEAVFELALIGLDRACPFDVCHADGINSSITAG